MPSSSLLLGVGAILSAFTSTVSANLYEELESYNGQNWMTGFEVKTDEFNNGFVSYQTEQDARDAGLLASAGNDILFGVDSTQGPLNWQNGPGRKSVRMEGRKDYNKGLFVLDVKSMPTGCGLWPAFWSLGREVCRTRIEYSR
jgi:hypothetical protein